MSSSIQDQITKIFDEYTEQVRETTNATFQAVAKKAVSQLKSTSPKKKGSYAKSWTYKKEGQFDGIDDIVIHNSKHYQLTHLLENGHVVKNKKGTYGRAPAHPHIKPVEDWANSEIPEMLKRGLEK